MHAIKRRRDSMEQGRPRVLVTAMGHIADTLTAGPVIRALRGRYPDCSITVLTFVSSAPLWERFPTVARVIVVPDRTGSGTRPALTRLLAIARLLPALRGRFDVAVVLQAGAGGNVLAALSGAPVRAGFAHRRTGRLLTIAVPPRDGLTPREANLEVARAIGLQARDARLHVFTTAADRTAAERLLDALGVADGSGPLVGLHPGSDWGCQMWGADRWAAVGGDLMERHGARLVITGVEQERAFAEAIAAGLPRPAAIACGQTSLPELAALIARLDLLVSVESGPVTLAVASGTPVVTLNGLYYDFERIPWGRLPGDDLALPVVARDGGAHRWYGDCRLATLRRERRCVNPACIGRGVMGEISVEQVRQAIDLQLESRTGVVR